MEADTERKHCRSSHPFNGVEARMGHGRLDRWMSQAGGEPGAERGGGALMPGTCPAGLPRGARGRRSASAGGERGWWVKRDGESAKSVAKSVEKPVETVETVETVVKPLEKSVEKPVETVEKTAAK